MEEDAAASRRLPKDGDLARVPAEESYVVLHPGQGHVLTPSFRNLNLPYLVSKTLIPSHLTL